MKAVNRFLDFMVGMQYLVVIFVVSLLVLFVENLA